MRPEDVDTLACWVRILSTVLQFLNPLVVALAHRIESKQVRRHVKHHCT